MKNDHICVRCNARGSYTIECPHCGARHTMRPRQEELFRAPVSAFPDGSSANDNRSASRVAPIRFRDDDLERVPTGLATLDRALGGGFVMGASTLLAGDPGAGKSTLALRLAEAIPCTCYVASEEGRAQIEDRAKRTQCALACPLITGKSESGDPNEDPPLHDPDELVHILGSIATRRRGLEGVRLVIVDSLQGFGSSLRQSVETAKTLEKMCHALGVALLVTGQVIKDGSIAGPNELRHLFDTVLLLEKTDTLTRIVTVDKSRYAPSPQSYTLRLSERGWEEALPEERAAEDSRGTEAGSAPLEA